MLYYGVLNFQNVMLYIDVSFCCIGVDSHDTVQCFHSIDTKVIFLEQLVNKLPIRSTFLNMIICPRL